MSAAAFFAVVATDRPGQAALRARLRPAHRAWLREHPGHAVEVLHGGPLLDAAGAMDGTLLVVRAPCAEDVRAFLAADPYVQAGLFAELAVRAWAWTLGRDEAPAQPAEAPSRPEMA